MGTATKPARSDNQVDYVFCKLWGLVTDARNLRMALARVASNRGRRTAGVDGITMGLLPVSFGFRPGKSVHGALEYLRVLLRPKATKRGPEPRLPYQWIVEGDIKGCFDNVDHRDRVGLGEPFRSVPLFWSEHLRRDD